MMYYRILVMILVYCSYNGAVCKDVGNEHRDEGLIVHLSRTQSGVLKLAVDQTSKEFSLKTSYGSILAKSLSDVNFASKNIFESLVQADGPSKTGEWPSSPASSASSETKFSLHSNLVKTITKPSSIVSENFASHSAKSSGSIYQVNTFESRSTVSQNKRTLNLENLPAVKPSQSSAVTLYSSLFTRRNLTMSNGSSSNMLSTSMLPLQTQSSVHNMANTSTFATSSTSPLTSLSGTVQSTFVSLSPVSSAYNPSSMYMSPVPSRNCSTYTVCSWGTMVTAAVGSSFLPTPLSSTAMSQSLTISPDLDSTSVAITTFISVIPSSAWAPIVTPSYSVVSNQSDIQPIAKEGCDVVLDGLATVMGKMTSCIISSLRPLQICEKCTHLHSDLKRYQLLISKADGCNQKLIMEYNAQYQAIPKIFKIQYDMWRNFECEKCYKERTDSDPKAPWIPKEEFIKTKSLVKEMMVCFANYSNEEIDLPFPVMLNVTEESNGTSWKTKENLCSNCRHAYKKLKKYMKSIHFEGSAEKRWCADMVYAFNETRRLWGKFCLSPDEDQEPIIALTCFFCFLPVVFYVGTKLHSDVKERKNESRVNYESD
ncbi:uncharacterized protein LOC135685281 [Rhopilema esculentum]|uniref:uncharacterized protein LOC135685281 n=1 Tax=Rhopilema esculentum TaxID=499914 RepID=UPI0031CEF2A1